MQREFVSYDIALKLKDLGFNETCFAIYENGKFLLRYKAVNSRLKPKIKLSRTAQLCITAPLYQQAFEFLMAKLEPWYPMLEITVFSDDSGGIRQSFDGLTNNDEVNIDFYGKEDLIIKLDACVSNCIW